MNRQKPQKGLRPTKRQISFALSVFEPQKPAPEQISFREIAALLAVKTTKGTE